MTCRCQMCGVKNAGRIGRGAYAKVGVQCYEEGHWSNLKDKYRKIRRQREKKQWHAEIAT